MRSVSAHNTYLDAGISSTHCDILVKMDEGLSTLSPRALTRRLIQELLPTDADLDGFCVDHFPKVHARFTSGMDRVSKINLLLALASPQEIVQRLQSVAIEPTKAQVNALNQILGDHRYQRMRQLEEELDTVCNQREELLSHSVNTEDLDRRILLLRREQRQGPQLGEGELLSERYKLRQILGTGGYADVWLAVDRRLQRLVAIKVLHPQWQRDLSRVERFERGARKMMELNHPHIVRVLSEPLHDSGFSYFVMEYLSGGDLGAAVRLPEYPIERLFKNLLQVGEALTHAHASGFVHRDVKPQNILLDAQQSARLTDFDLVTGFNTTGGTIGGGLGTFAYAAPEQLDNASSVDFRSDVYSLGMVALSLFARQEIPVRATRNIDKFIEELAVNDSVKAAVRRATSWEPSERHASIAMFCHEVELAWQQPQVPVVKQDRPSAKVQTHSASVPSLIWTGVTEEQVIKSLEGIWIGDSQTTYCIKFIDGALRCAYCYHGIGELTGHIFDMHLSGDQLFGRFTWIKQPEVNGYHYFRIVLDDSMVGAWCYSFDVREQGGGGIIDTVLKAMKTQKMVSILAHRALNVQVYPLWAEEYFEQRMWLTIHKSTA